MSARWPIPLYMRTLSLNEWNEQKVPLNKNFVKIFFNTYPNTYERSY